MKIKIPALIICCFCTAFLLGINITFDDQTDVTNSSQWIGFSTAHASKKDRGVARRTARRTARRVNRRHDNYRSLPHGCTKIIINGSVYRNCSGIYYEESYDRDDVTYIIVNP